ncbi:MAG: OmpH family outer membrane protein [Bacteroidetes bacterium]|nr:OmpH family outer membrane protein [Bacteroidota bacterium]
MSLFIHSVQRFKKIVFLFSMTAFMGISSATMAQKYAYVNTQYILDNMTEYKTAQQQLDNMSIQWQKDIEDKYSIVDKLYKAYQAEQILLTEEMKKKRQDEITAKEKDVKDLQKQRFGYEGDLFKKKQDLVKPIQDKVFNAVKKLATDQGFAVIFDKSGDLIMLYANPKYDKSDDILLALGYKPGKKEGGDSKTGTGSGTTKTPRTSEPNKSEDQPKK